MAQTIINGLALGALYALVAVGLALVFGVLRLINFAQGELITAGAYSLNLTSNLPLAVSIVICFVVCVVLSVAIERIAFRPLRGAAPATTLVATFAVAFALEAVWLIAFGTNGKPADLLSTVNQIAIHGSLNLRWITIIELGAGVLLLGGTALILGRTQIGLQMRAAAADFRTARLLGVRANAVISFAFVIAGLMAAVVALLFTVQQPLVTPTFGLSITIIALVGAVVGGVDRLWSATAGGFAIGFATSVLNDVLPSSQQKYQTAWVFLLVIVLLLLRPGGLFAPLRRATVERV
ncbi:MAG: branched-chain amino acid ABC transporter permease [Solirubrobacterales bacterium]|nr:branched-chain amino acid ABC transporter permease [Solirubrobacterales bacterium]MBV9918088.1 branched-chain amino acid ABC transporter permease [Solirubrobacterales bacterium]